MRLAAIAAAIALVGCAQPQPLLKETPSGYPEETIAGATTEQVRSAIMETCISRGVLVQESTPQQVVCGKTMSGSDAMLATLMIGNSYSTTPERKVRFT